MEGFISRIRKLCGRASRTIQRVWNTNRHLCLVLLGTLGLAHGDDFAYTVLVSQTFMSTGWPVIRNGLERAAAAYEEAKQVGSVETAARRAASAGKRDELKQLSVKVAQLRAKDPSSKAVEAATQSMVDLRQELDELPQSRRAGPVLAAMMLREPMVFRNLWVGLWSGMSISVAAATNAAARSLGLGLSIGQSVAHAMASVVHRVDLALHVAQTGLPANAAAASYFGPAKSVSALIWLMGRGAGIWFAFKLQSLAMAASACLIYAKAVVSGVRGLGGQLKSLVRGPSDTEASSMGSAQRDLAIWALALGGLYLQHQWTLPLPVRALLLPAYAVEGALKGIALKLTKDDFDSAEKAKRGK